MQLKVRALVFIVASLTLILILACSKDKETKIVNVGYEVENFEPDKLNAYPIIGYMQTGSVVYPALDGDAKDEIWGLTEPYEITTTADDNGFAPTVTLKALYDNYYLFILATWQDSTNDFRKDMWYLGSPANGDTTWADQREQYTWHQISDRFNGYIGMVDKIRVDTTVVPPDTQYVYKFEPVEISGDEDAFAIMWNVNSTNFINCANLCHGESMSTDTDEKTDLWYWAAARTNPKKYADDLSLTDAGFEADKGDAVFKPNNNDGEPEFANVQDPGSNRSFLYDSTATKYYGTLAWKGGNRIPGYVLGWPSGSRADIRAVGKYQSGTWTVEIRRRLDTMVEDGSDIIFNPDMDANVSFHLAVYNNAHGKSHAISSDTHLLHFLQLKK